jgi:hypothetical protein
MDYNSRRHKHPLVIALLPLLGSAWLQATIRRAMCGGATLRGEQNPRHIVASFVQSCV